MNKRNLEDDDHGVNSRSTKIKRSEHTPKLFVDKRKCDVEFPFFRKPVEVGAFSLNLRRQFLHDKSQMKYYVRPKDYDNVEFDLRVGYNTMIKKDESVLSYLNDILKWIQVNRHKFAVDKQPLSKETSELNLRLNTDFICWRGLLTKLLCTPYENKDGWRIAVTQYNGTFYLCEWETEQKKEQEANKTERDMEMCCWGWKFEQYVTAKEENGKAVTDEQYNNIEAFCTVVRGRLNTHSIVYSGEVDAVDTSRGKDRQHYVEFKTSRELTHERQHMNFRRFKLIKWWAQSYLVAIPEIICGFRDDDGVVHRLESFDTHRIPEMGKEFWKPNVCFNFLDQFLSYVKSVVTVDDHRVVYLMEWSPRSPVSCTKLEPDSDYCFLPSWYTDT